MSISDLCASLVAGGTAEIAVLPICTIQTVYQTQKNLSCNTNRQNVFTISKNLYKNHGFKAFYNASISGISNQMVSTGSKFTLYKMIQKVRGTETKDITNNIVNGTASGLLSIAFTQPFDVLKNYHQRQKRYNH